MTLPEPVAAPAVPDPQLKVMDPLVAAVIVAALWIPIHMKISRWIDRL